MEEILIISNYYPPEKGAAANRIEQLALKLNQNNYKVTVVCPLGNYPKGKLFPEYKGKFFVNEKRDNITVKRLWIFPSISTSILVRMLSILSFSSCLFIYLLFIKTPKKVVVQSPPLFISFISVFVLSFKQKKIILNVSDLWPLAAIELNALKRNSLSHKFSMFLEKSIYKKATVILGQSNEIIKHIQTIFPEKQCYLYRNFPDHKIDTMDLITNENEPIKLFYAGLLGVAQGVLELCEKIDIKNLNIELHLYGDGVEKKQIEAFIFSKKESKIFFHGIVDRHDLHEKLKTFDIALVPLKTRIYGSVPSKIFEYGSLGFPVLYFGGGEGELIIKENNMGWIASVGDYQDLNEKLILISKIEKSELHLIKKRLFAAIKRVFDLECQMKNLIKKNVF